MFHVELAPLGGILGPLKSDLGVFSDLNVVMTVIILIITIVNENWDRFAPFLFFSAKSAVSH